MSPKSTAAVVAWAALALACARTPGASPHDMSAEQHEATARAEQRRLQGGDPRAREVGGGRADLAGPEAPHERPRD